VTVPAAVTVPGSRTEVLAAACDSLLWSAMTVAGHRLTRTPACPRSERLAARSVPAHLIHTVYPVPEPGDVDRWHLFDGAWHYVPEVCTRYGANPAALTSALDGYVRDLVAARVGHSFENTPRLLLRTAGLWATVTEGKSDG
jgi:hypothetical protein